MLIRNCHLLQALTNFVDGILNTLEFSGGCNFQKGKYLRFCLAIIRDREVGGSNPLAPTKFSKKLPLFRTCHERRIFRQDRGNPIILSGNS